MNLDQQQQAAAATTSPLALVLAGAGSGKTRVLIERIAWLIETQKVSPTEVLAFSFTRKASGEIRDRLKERIGGKAHGVQMGTMHGLALEFIHRFGEVIGLRPASVTIYGDWESGYLLADVAQEMSAKKPTIKAAREALERYYQTGEEPKEEDPGHDLFEVFLARCRENNALTYGALLVGLRLLIPTLAKYLHVRHILVDEVQDLDRLQWSIVNEMTHAFKANLFVVGDVSQSIYEFRGAIPKYLVDHSGEFDIYNLESNYRSLSDIVKASNRLIENNTMRLPLTMRATRTDPDSVVDNVTVMRDMDSKKIVSEAGLFSAPLAILARKHSLLGKIDRLMEEAGIPHTYIGKTTALTNSEPFRRFHAFLKLAVNPFDNMSFLLIRDIIGLSREEYGRIRLSAAQTGRSHFQVLIERYALVSIEDLNITHLENTPLITGGSLSQCAEWLNEHHPDLSPESMVFIQKYVTDHLDDIASYLDWLATFDVQDEIKGEETEGITLATIHAAKGLEWPVVIVAGCNEGIIPGRPNDPDEIEGERRLMYVAMTRAMGQLVLTIRPTESTDASGKVHTSPESRFIMELRGEN